MLKFSRLFSLGIWSGKVTVLQVAAARVEALV